MAEEIERFEFPDFIRKLPEADIPYAGLRGMLAQGDRGQMVFNEADTEVDVVEHSHGEQWGVVLEGRVDFIIRGQKQSYYAGDSYYIPAGVPHGVTFHPGARSLDFFSDRDRYPARIGRSQGRS
jgi:mannose-6-phosphate isomerase-like protein (cupin superfamily)